jgi:L-ascorbate metabolism protein UlaG (beta-lactamase superfamily)
VHSDHLGNAKLAVDPGGTDAKCDGSFARTSAVPNSNLVEIAVAKNSAVLVSGDVASLLSRKIQTVRGTPTQSCPASGPSNLFVVPLSAPCIGSLGFGAKRTVAMAADMPGVQITAVTAIHGNALDNSFTASPLSDNLASNGLSLTVGPPIGYGLTFTNGLVVYLSGDTGQTADMSAVVRDYYRARLAILNIGDIFTTGPEEAAYAAKSLLRVAAAIPSHANEVATSGGELLPGSKTARFVTALGGLPVFLPLSGRTMLFDSDAVCVAGCDASPAMSQQ